MRGEGVPQILFTSIFFCELKPHAKLQTLGQPPLAEKSSDQKKKLKEEKKFF